MNYFFSYGLQLYIVSFPKIHERERLECLFMSDFSSQNFHRMVDGVAMHPCSCQVVVAPPFSALPSHFVDLCTR